MREKGTEGMVDKKGFLNFPGNTNCFLVNF